MEIYGVAQYNIAKWGLVEYETHERFMLHIEADNFLYLNTLLTTQNISIKWFISVTTIIWHFDKATFLFDLSLHYFKKFSQRLIKKAFIQLYKNE